MKLASSGIQHETNTFASTPTTIDDFVRDSNCGANLDGGEIIFRHFRDTGTIHGGYIAATDADPDVELVPLLCARAQPSGIVAQACFDEMLQRFLQRLQNILPVDGVLLDLHGAMVTEDHDDAEGAFIAATRELVGDGIPIVVTLDLHANISARMAELSDVIIGFDTYPHVDMRQRGIEAAQLMARIVRGEVKPVQQFRQVRPFECGWAVKQTRCTDRPSTQTRTSTRCATVALFIEAPCCRVSKISSVMPYRDGLLVTAAPDLLFLRDTDDDGHADERRVVWTGFGTEQSQQLRANALHWGLDNYIYGANGRSDGGLCRGDDSAAVVSAPISLRTRDFRFGQGGYPLPSTSHNM